MKAEEPRAGRRHALGRIAPATALIPAYRSQMASAELGEATSLGWAAVGLPDDRQRALDSARHAVGGERRRLG